MSYCHRFSREHLSIRLSYLLHQLLLRYPLSWNWLKSKIIELQLLSLKSEVEFERHVGFTEARIRKLFNKYQIITGQQQTSFRSLVESW